jgi:hypothetical protein
MPTEPKHVQITKQTIETVKNEINIELFIALEHGNEQLEMKNAT